MASYEILIADDHPLFRSALHQALTLGLGPDVRLVEAASIAELEARLNEKADWDLVLLDLNMPGAYGFSGLVLLRGQYPQVPVVMISAQEEAAVVQAPAASYPSPVRWKPCSRRCARCSTGTPGGRRRMPPPKPSARRPRLPAPGSPASPRNSSGYSPWSAKGC